MATYDRRRLTKVLRDKFSFIKSQNDHDWYDLEVSGVVLASTFVSSGGHGKDIDQGLQKLMARELHLSKRDFCRAIECPMTRAEYYNLLTARNPEHSQAIRDAI